MRFKRYQGTIGERLPSREYQVSREYTRQIVPFEEEFNQRRSFRGLVFLSVLALFGTAP